MVGGGTKAASVAVGWLASRAVLAGLLTGRQAWVGGDVGYSFRQIGEADTPGKRLVLELAAPTYLAHSREPHVPRSN